MDEFEQWFINQDFYTNMRFIHGDALFIKDGDVYRVLPVHIAFESWFASACTSIDHIHRLQHEKADQKAEIDEKDKRIENISLLVISLRNEFDLHGGGDQVERQIELLEEALRGECE